MSTVKTTNIQHPSSGTANVVLSSDGNVSFPNANGYLYAGTRYYTSSGTFAKADPLGTGDIGLRAIRVRMVGGGGGGASGEGGGSTKSGGGGAGGGYAERFFTDIAAMDASVTVTRGAGGAGATTANTDGSAGGESSFGGSGDAWRTRASGGSGGRNHGLSQASAGGTGLDGDLLVQGGPGEACGAAVLSQNAAGAGGSSVLGGGAATGRPNQNRAGIAGGLYGGGGSGSVGGASVLAAGAGGNGIVIVDCFV